MKKFMIAILLSAAFAAPALANDHEKGKDKSGVKAEYYMNKMDANGDGKISQDEHRAFNDQMFNEADTNNDGFLTKDEFIAKKKAEKAKFKGKEKSDDNKSDTRNDSGRNSQ